MHPCASRADYSLHPKHIPCRPRMSTDRSNSSPLIRRNILRPPRLWAFLLWTNRALPCCADKRKIRLDFRSEIWDTPITLGGAYGSFIATYRKLSQDPRLSSARVASPIPPYPLTRALFLCLPDAATCPPSPGPACFLRPDRVWGPSSRQAPADWRRIGRSATIAPPASERRARTGPSRRCNQWGRLPADAAWNAEPAGTPAPERGQEVRIWAFCHPSCP